MPARNAKPIFIAAGGLSFSQPGGVVADLQNPVVELPYMTKANNIVFEEGGTFRKVGGALLAHTLSRTNNIKAILPASGTGGVDFYTIEQDTGVFGWQLDTGSQTATQVGQHLASGAASTTYTTWDISEFEGYSVIASGDTNIAPILLTPSTFTTTAFAAGQPHFSMSAVYANRLWVAGNPANPSRLYYSDLNDPTTGYSANFLDIDPADGSEITGLHIYRGRLFIFKGSTKGSIHVLSGRTPSTFALDIFSATVGCAGPSAITDFADDVMFMDTDGHLRTLATTEKFGDFETTVITDPIREYVSGTVSKSNLKYAAMHTDTINSRVWVQAPTGSTQQDRTSIIVDYKQGIKITLADWINPAYIVPARANSTSQGRQRLVASVDRNLYTVDEINEERIETFTSSGGIVISEAAYTAEVEFPSIKFTPAFGHNNISKISASIQHLAKRTDVVVDACSPFDPNVDITFKWQRDANELESVDLSATVTSRLGSVCGFTPLPSDGSIFTLDASRLGGLKTMEVYAELETSDFRRITFMFEQGGLNEGLHVHSFSAVIGQDDTGSTENL